MNKDQFIFISINLCPYSPQSILANNYPASKDVGDNNDFIYQPDISHIAISLQVVNLYFGKATHIAHTQNFTACLCDSNKVLASADFSLKMQPWVEIESPRIDLSLEHVDLRLMHKYRVCITRKGGKLPIREAHIRFFPDGYQDRDCVTVEAGYILAANCCRNIQLTDYLSPRVCFMLENNRYDWENLPEIIIRIYDTNGEPKRCLAEIERLDGNYFVAKAPLDWTPTIFGALYAELVIFDQKITGFVFQTDVDDEEGTYSSNEMDVIEYYRPDSGINVAESRTHKQEKAAAEDYQGQLDALVGLENVKSKVRDYADLMRFNLLRCEASLPYQMPPLHAVFMGSPGTGKTTVAKIMGQLLKDAGVLSKGHVVVRERATLLGQNYNSESERTLEALEEAKGGILFIDEAYQLYQPNDARDPGKFVIETLLTALADDKNRDWMLILAGYTEPMKRMMGMNPGLASRIPASNIYTFDDYTSTELLDIATRYLDANKYTLTDEAKDALVKLISSDYNNRDENFGNARHIMNIIQTGIIPAMARRIISIPSPTIESLSLIESSDIPSITLPNKDTRRRVGFATR